jgi:hypothetical protein
VCGDVAACAVTSPHTINFNVSLMLFLRQFICASVGENNFDNIKMLHGMYVKKWD